jgi:mannose/fructose/N-acetylgalactosamine-specific phosphotransferase system component IIC
MREFMKLGYVTATTLATLTLGTGIVTIGTGIVSTSIAYSAEERVKSDRAADKLEKAADKLESRHSLKSDIALLKRYFVE